MQLLSVKKVSVKVKVKVKVKLSLCLIKHHAMKTYWGGGIATRILDLGTRWRWVVSFTHLPPYPQGKSLWYPLDGRLVAPRAVLNAMVRKTIPSPRRESNPRTPIVHPVAQRYTDWINGVICQWSRQISVFVAYKMSSPVYLEALHVGKRKVSVRSISKVTIKTN
jgi:hypothetical protein